MAIQSDAKFCKAQALLNNQSAASTTDTKSVIGDEYVLVKRDYIRKSQDTKCVSAAGVAATTSVQTASEEPTEVVKQQLLFKKLMKPRFARSNGFGSYKTKPFKIKLFENWLFNTNGSGVVASSITMDPTTISEFSSLAALFDEFRVVGFEYEYMNMNSVQNTGANLEAFCAIGYDPTDGTAPSSVTSVMQLDNHQLSAKNVLSAGGAPVLLHLSQPTYQFKARVPPGILNAAGTPSSVGTACWQPTAGATVQPYGWLKAYGASMGVSSSTLCGVAAYHVEFRLRA